MGAILLKLLNMSIAASWLILAVLLLRLLLKKAPRWIHCLLWGFVAVRLICPFSIESAYSLIPSAKTVQADKITDEDGHISQNIPMIDSRMPMVSNVVNPILRETFIHEGEENAAPMQIYAYAAGIVWCCGVLLLLIYAFISWLRILNMVKEAVCHRDNIYLCDAVESPFIFGVIRPRIYLPSCMETDTRERDYVIAHEQAHLKRKDYWWKPLGYLLLAVYWFNPLCWIAYAYLCRDIEFACDEKVIRDMSFNEKKEYSKTLLSWSTGNRRVRICPLAFGGISVKGRIKSVLDYKKAPFIILLAAVVLCVIVGILFMTNPPREYQIRVTIPAGSTGQFSYSDEEICPKGSTLTFYAGEGLGDTEIVLLPVESKVEKVYAPTYITPGMPVKLEAEKGAWYKIGVNVQNPADEDRDVYVSVNNVVVRIASIADGTENHGNSGEEAEDSDIRRLMASAENFEDYESLRETLKKLYELRNVPKNPINPEGTWNRTNVCSGYWGTLTVSQATDEGFFVEGKLGYYSNSGGFWRKAYYVADNLAIVKFDPYIDDLEPQYMAFFLQEDSLKVTASYGSRGLGLGESVVIDGEYVQGEPVYTNANVLEELFTEKDMEALEKLLPEEYYKDYFLFVTKAGIAEKSEEALSDGWEVTCVEVFVPTMKGRGYTLYFSSDEGYYSITFENEKTFTTAESKRFAGRFFEGSGDEGAFTGGDCRRYRNYKGKV